uniref:Uncharacterized protein n=1 Tax=Siphoviridae sp. ctCNm48 TaxID=2825377 RepID=A0A8S5TW84_9CAUD|nr:MAG TPA: hypothetical protein [Siphoviridae sp. ctCNm48]
MRYKRKHDQGPRGGVIGKIAKHAEQNTVKITN